MNRRSFLGALGGASGASLAGCTDLEIESVQDGTSLDPVEDRVEFLERQRAAVLYAGGVRQAAAGEVAYPDLQVHPSKSPYSYAELAVHRGRRSGYYDAAAWNFARAGAMLANLDGSGVDAGVEACMDARTKAYHRGMGNVYWAIAVLDQRYGGAEKRTPISVLDDEADRETPTPTDDEGMSVAGTPQDDDEGMSVAQRPEEDSWKDVSGDTPDELADAHFDRANDFEVVPVEDLRRNLGLTDG